MTPRKTKQVTMADIAKRASVSVPTVSYILNGRARERNLSASTVNRVTQVAQELGYIRNGIASNLRRRRTNSIAFLVSDLERGWANRVMQGMLQVLDERGMNLSLAVHFWDPNRERRELETAMEEKKAGIIARPLGENIRTYQIAMDRGIPLVMLDEIPGLKNVSSVMWDPSEAIAESIRRLRAAGRDRIGYVGVDRGTSEESLRLQAFLSAMEGAGLKPDRRWICIDKRYTLKDEGPRGGRVQGYGEALSRMMESVDELPNAIIASADALACMAMSILREDYGKSIPDDIAIVGMGDNGESPIIGLSSSPEPLEALGRTSAEVLLGLIDGELQAPVCRRLTTSDVYFRDTTPTISPAEKLSV